MSDNQFVVREEEPDLPEIDNPNWDWGVILPLIPEKAQKVAYAVLAILGFVVAATAGVFRTLYLSDLVSHGAAFLALTVASIVLGLVSSLTAILGYAKEKNRMIFLDKETISNLETTEAE